MTTDIERTYRDHLRSEERHLDAEVEARLMAARKRAVEQPDHPILSRVWLPAAGMTVASVLVVALLLSPHSEVHNGREKTVSADIAPMEDLDFYYWLAETQNRTES